MPSRKSPLRFSFSFRRLLGSFPVLLGLIVITAPRSCPAQTWPAFRGDNARSGIARESIDCSRLELTWTWESELPPEPAWDGPARWDAFNAIRDLPAMRQYDGCFHPVSDGKRVYFGSSSQDALYALDLESGKPVWTFTANGPIRLAPSLHKGKVYFGCDDGFAYCLDSSSGQLRWKFSPSHHAGAESRRVINNDRLISFYPVRTGVTIRDDLAFFAGSYLPWRESFICAVDAETGKLETAKSTFVERHEKATLEGSLLVTHDRIIVPQGRIPPLMFDRSNGKKLGSLPGGGGVTIVLTEQGDVVRTEGGGPARSGQIGVFKGKDRVASFPRGRAIVVDKDRYFVIDQQKLFAASRTNNELKWQLTVDEPLELVKIGNQLIVGGRDHLTAVNANNGDVIWSAEVKGRVFGLAVASGRVIASTDAGHLYAFAATAGQSWKSNVKTGADSGSAQNWKSPDVPAVRDRDLLHRWVFHRAGMKQNKKTVTDRKLANVTVRDQAGAADIRLRGSASAIRMGDSNRIEALELQKSYFPIAEDIAARLPDGPISVESWVRVDEPATWGGIIGCIQDDGSTEHGWLLGYRGDKFCFALAGSKSGLTYLTAPTSFESKAWYHLVGTYDGNQMRLYVNGQLAAKGDQESGPISYAAKRIFTIGAYRDANESFPMLGAVQEIRVYSTSLNAPAVARRYKSTEVDFPKIEKRSLAAADRFLSWGPIANYVRPGTVEITYGTKYAANTVVDLITDREVKRFADTEKKLEHKMLLDKIPHRRELQFQIRDQNSDQSKATEGFALDSHFNWSLPLDPGRDAWSESVLKSSPNPRGLAIVVGETLATQAFRLARHSQLSVVLVVGDDATADRIRAAWRRESTQSDVGNGGPGKMAYGKKLSVQPIRLEDLPAAFASVVVSKTDNARTRRLVRPAGGILHDTQQLAWTRGSLSGSGVWSHMYGTADNSAFGGETLSHASNRSDLMTQWIGRPGPRYQTDRQNRKPSPLAAGGRLFLQGQQRMIALDSFSGSILWSVESPTVMRWNVPHDSSNWCADETGVYVATADRALFFDGRSGQVARQYRLPATAGLPANSHWGYIARQKDLLIGTAVKPDAIYKNWWGKTQWFDSTGGADTHVVAGDCLFALNLKTGQKAWSHAGLILHPTVTIVGDRVYFVEDRTSLHRDSDQRRISIEKGQDHHLVCLDLQTGKRVWNQKLNSFAGHVSSLYLAAGGKDPFRRLVMVASEATKSHFAVSTFDLDSGEPGWQKEVRWEANHHGKHISRPAIQGELVYLRPEVLKLETGETLTRGFPSGHGCSSYTLCTGGLFSRLGETTWWDVRNKKVHRFDRIRTDCWISVIPAQGMLLSAEGGGGCSCGSWLETSLGFLPRSVNEHKPEK